MTAVRAMPILNVRDVEETASFLAKGLGFALAGSWKDDNGSPFFGIVRNGNVTLGLNRKEKVEPQEGWAAYIYVEDIAALWDIAKAQGLDMSAIEDKFYGCRETQVSEPSGNVLCFAQDLEPGADGPGL